VEETVVDDQRDEGVDNQELANLLLQLGEEVEPMRVDYEAEEEDEGQQHQQQPYQLTPCYRELTRSKCPGPGHLDELADSGQTQASQQKA
jgi:hypothetical protein